VNEDDFTDELKTTIEIYENITIGDLIDKNLAAKSRKLLDLDIKAKKE